MNIMTSVVATSGILRKMSSQFANPIEYSLKMTEENISLNNFLGKLISLEFTGNIYCIQCQKKTTKSFQQGFCFPCFKRLQECNLCIIHPERCLVEQNGCSSDDWAHQHCHGHHHVYLANASGLKIGMTRFSQIPTRWIDQGASQALSIFEVNNRYQAGVLEVLFKEFVADKTNWRIMLKQPAASIDLITIRDELLKKAEIKLQCHQSNCQDNQLTFLQHEIVELNFPVLKYPTVITNLSLDKTRVIQGELWGIKGQYLILNTGVINIRKFSGYEVILTV